MIHEKIYYRKHKFTELFLELLKGYAAQLLDWTMEQTRLTLWAISEWDGRRVAVDVYETFSDGYQSTI